MLRKIFGLAMVALLMAAFSLQGSAVMRCACSGEYFLAGWQEVGCGAEEISAGCDCCGEEQEIVEAECGKDCCWLVGLVPEFETLSGLTLETPQPSVADLEPGWDLLIDVAAWGSDVGGEFRKPDPPGVPLRVLYGVYLV